MLPAHILLPAISLVVFGLTSIIYARLKPDPGVTDIFRHSHASWTLVNIIEMLLLFGLPVVLIVIPHSIRRARDVKWIVIVCAVLGIIYALATIQAAPFSSYSQLMILSPTSTPILGLLPPLPGMQLVFFVCVAMGQALYARQRTTAFYWWLLTLIVILATLLSFDRTAWIILSVSTLTMLGLRTRNIGVLPLILAILLLLWIPAILNFIIPDQAYNVGQLFKWQEAIDIWRHQPWIGIGAGNYQFFTNLYGIAMGSETHNQYVEVLAEMGVQGLLCLVWMVIAIGYIALQRFKQAMTGASKAITVSYLGYYTALLILSFSGNSFLPSAADTNGTSAQIIASYHWFLLGIVLNIPQWEKAGTPPDQAPLLDTPKKQLHNPKKCLS
ncbi:O-antigen ligase family protein [Dictyobacter kobayashii]|uniref:O-antigen ligase-related domain-containing protein n=1 Tax=Dictyobacter kobayashii TaxID=2014872 RepID=A0A402AWN5_9CHLR|nr:O-antigen ligase family protein [Dictyobacter kobayashii]GCE23464.1 hypothetical protein KDK_72640 [Dictyobacter kobayashii]